MGKKVLFVWDNLAVYGGVRTFIVNCLKFLPERGYEAQLIDLHDRPVTLDEEARVFEDRIFLLPRRRWDSERSFEVRLCELLSREQPDLVVFTEWRHAEDVLRCIPAAVPVLNFCLVDRPDVRYYEYANVLAPRMSLILGNSYFITRRLRETLDPGFHYKISELFIGVQVPGKWRSERVESDRLHLVYMSRLNQEQKRARDLVPFCRGLEKSGIDFHLTVVGDGDERAFIEKEIRNLIADGRVEMTGTLAFPDAMERFNNQDIFLLLSAYEGMPLVLLHALAAGVVPVVTNVQSGVSEILDDGKNGFLFPVGKPEAAVDLVKALNDDRVRLMQMRQAARSLGEQNSIRVTMVEFEKRLQQIFKSMPLVGIWKSYRVPDVPGDCWKTRLAYRLPKPILKWIGYA